MIAEMTLAQIVANTTQIDTTKRQHVSNEVRLVGGLQIVSLDDDTILVKSKTSKGYHPAIRLPVTVDPDSQLIVVLVDGTQLAIQPVSRTHDDVHVTCTCKDFVYRFAGINTKRDVMFGNIARMHYVRKTQTKRTVTPYTEPAVCKHLLKLLQVIQTHGIVK